MSRHSSARNKPGIWFVSQGYCGKVIIRLRQDLGSCQSYVPHSESSGGFLASLTYTHWQLSSLSFTHSQIVGIQDIMRQRSVKVANKENYIQQFSFIACYKFGMNNREGEIRLVMTMMENQASKTLLTVRFRQAGHRLGSLIRALCDFTGDPLVTDLTSWQLVTTPISHPVLSGYLVSLAVPHRYNGNSSWLPLAKTSQISSAPFDS